jgi:DNA polymerase I-like protein with 3'-5' exonuclease and polymerase domains
MSEIRKYYASRFAGGKLLEIDFSQLEIFVLAYLSGDPWLRQDLLSGADLHGISAAALFGGGWTKQQRKIAKQLSFQLQYGAGAKSMATTNGVPYSTAKKFIDNYYDRYPMIKEYQDNLIEVVNKLRKPTSRRSAKGNPVGKAKFTSLTGRIYTFIENDAPDFLASETSFSPTQIKNFQVQGFATGDIVPLVLGKLHRGLIDFVGDSEQVLLINTVHDSVMFDCISETVARSWAKNAVRIMENAPLYLDEAFGIDFDLPLRVEVEMGDNWAEMKPLDL